MYIGGGPKRCIKLEYVETTCLLSEFHDRSIRIMYKHGWLNRGIYGDVAQLLYLFHGKQIFNQIMIVPHNHQIWKFSNLV